MKKTILCIQDSFFYILYTIKSRHISMPALVRVEGLEPSRREAPDPKSGASAIPPHSHVCHIL